MGMPEHAEVLYLKTRSQVVAGIQEWILEEGLRPGDRLPAPPELARALRVTANSVRQALAVLESMRLLERGPGGHHRLGGEPSAVVDRLLRLRMAVSGFDPGDLMSVRVDLERASAARAATSATEAELAPLHAVVREMADPAVDCVRFGELDCTFHLILAQAGHNELATLLLTTLGDAMRHEMLTGYDRSPQWRATAIRLAGEHQHILDAVEARDPHRAADVVARHIGRFYDLQAS